MYITKKNIEAPFACAARISHPQLILQLIEIMEENAVVMSEEQ